MWIVLIAAAAADPCEVTVDAASWRWQLEQAAEQLAGANIAGGRATLASARNRAACLKTVVSPTDLVLFARLQAVSAFYDQEVDRVDEWAKLAAVALPLAIRSSGPAWLDDHPVQRYLDRPAPSWSPWPYESAVVAPKRGGVFLNGLWLDEAEFPAATPCLVQILDKRGERVDAWWQHGAASPPDRLLPADIPAVRPKFYDGPAVTDVSR